MTDIEVPQDPTDVIPETSALSTSSAQDATLSTSPSEGEVQASGESTPQETTPPKEVSSKVRITLIDDEPSVLFALKLLLEALGFSIADFSDSELAIAHLASPDVADVCLCDLRMPKRNGLQVLEEVKKIAPTLPFILMSAHASDAELQKAKLLGANGVLTKPFTPDDLQAALVLVRKRVAVA